MDLYLKSSDMKTIKIGSGESVAQTIDDNGHAFETYNYNVVAVTNGENTIYATRDATAIKSADPVVYDDSGKVIPLSERFNPESEDIRYSLQDSEGNNLTEEQAEFFKDSKVRKNGKLLPVYHGTPAENITIFDPEKSDDSISLFFTDNEELASTFGKEKYKLYLNLKNPLTIDGNGSEWHRIRGKNKNTFKREFQDFRINTDYDKYEGEEIFTFSFTGEIEKGSPVSAEYLDEEGMASFLVEDLGMEENVVEELTDGNFLF